MLRAVPGREAELDVGDGRGLRRGPVQARGGNACGDGGGVDDEVLDLPEEDVDGGPGEARGAVGVPVDDAEGGVGGEGGGGLDDGAVRGVADELGVVVVDDGVGDEVGSGLC